MILHIDMDAFFASIEQAINPHLKGKALVVGARPNKLHTVVCAASYEAKSLGISSGMSVKDALKLCPHLEFVTAEQEKYIWTSEEILRMLKSYGFCVEYASIDEFRIDLPDGHDCRRLAAEIQGRIEADFGITASIGIAQNCLLAKLASKINKPNGIACIDQANLEKILSKTPIEKLNGIGTRTAPFLHGLGINTCLDLFNRPQDFLEEKLGKNGTNLYLSLHFKENLDPQEIDSAAKSVGHSYTFPMASKNPGFIRAWIRLLSEMVARRLRQDDLVSESVHLWLSTSEGVDFAAQKTFQQAINDGFEIYGRALKIYASSGLEERKIRAIGLTCAKLQKDLYGQPLFNEQSRRQGLIRAVDAINSHYGEDTMYPAVIFLAKKM